MKSDNGKGSAEKRQDYPEEIEDFHGFKEPDGNDKIDGSKHNAGDERRQRNLKDEELEVMHICRSTNNSRCCNLKISFVYFYTL